MLIAWPAKNSSPIFFSNLPKKHFRNWFSFLSRFTHRDTSFKSWFCKDSNDGHRWSLRVVRATEREIASLKSCNLKHEAQQVELWFMQHQKTDVLSFHLMFWSLKFDHWKAGCAAHNKYSLHGNWKMLVGHAVHIYPSLHLIITYACL